MRPSIVASLLLLFIASYALVTEAKLQQQATIDANDDDDDDDRDDDDDDLDHFRPEVDDDGRIYKNPRNSPSAMCPRDEKQAEVLDQTCLRRCSADEDCKSKKKKCRCDGPCGMSCVKTDKECPKLPELEHGKMRVTGNFFGDNANYVCDNNYYLIGLSDRTCRADGRWTGIHPTCTKDRNLFCIEPPKISNARHYAPVEQKGFDLNTTIQYFCDYGYQTTGFQNAMCLVMDSKASWFGPDILCEAVNCGLPVDIANGWHGGDCYTFNCTVTYHCVDGYKLTGKPEKVCLADGVWSPKDIPQCIHGVPAQCPLPDNPRNGKAVYTSYAYNAIVSYECRHGYVLMGMATRKCQADRKWSGQMPVCEEINCGSPGILYNGWIDNIEAGTGLGASIIFRCKEHMKLVGNTSSVCESDGKWRYPVPQCLAPCVIPQIEKGFISIASHEPDHINNVTVVEHGDRINVNCIKNYEFVSNNTPVMCNNGTWTIIPTCSPARCKQMPRTPKNGMVIAPKMNHGMRAIFKCKDGFALVGGGPVNSTIKYVECNYGNWIGDSPHCTEVYCSFPGSVENGKVLLVGNMGVYDYRPYVKKVPNNKQIMYDCDKGYVLEDGPTGATCVGGKWSPQELPACTLGQHPRLRWSRRRRSTVTNHHQFADNNNSTVINFKKFLDYFRRVGKKLLHLELEKAQANELSDVELNNVMTVFTFNDNNESDVSNGSVSGNNRLKYSPLNRLNKIRSSDGDIGGNDKASVSSSSSSDEKNKERNIDRTIDNLILKRKHPSHKKQSRSKDDKMIEFLKTVYRKLKRIDAKRINNNKYNNNNNNISVTNATMHDILNVMSKNFFHVDLSAVARKNNTSSRNHDNFELRNQREFVKLKREFERIMRFYNKSLRWSERQNRKDTKKRKTKSHDGGGGNSNNNSTNINNINSNGKKERKRKDNKLKNYYRGFYEFINGYVNEKLSILESQNSTDELIDNINLDKFNASNESSFTVGEVYAFFKHIIENKLNYNNNSSSSNTDNYNNNNNSNSIDKNNSSKNNDSNNNRITSTLPPVSIATPAPLLNNNKHNETLTTAPTVTTIITTKTATPTTTTVIPGNSTGKTDLINEIPLTDNKTVIAKHRTKRIRNAIELKANVTHQNRKLLTVNMQQSNEQNNDVTMMQQNSHRNVDNTKQNIKSKQFKHNERMNKQLNNYDSSNSSRLRRFTSSTEINNKHNNDNDNNDNQITLKNLYLNAYDDEYRASIRRSIVDATNNINDINFINNNNKDNDDNNNDNNNDNYNNDNNNNRANQTVSRRRKGNLSFYDNE